MTDLTNRGLIVLNDHEGGAETRRGSTIVVTGVARGGTSLLAQMLNGLGLFMGDLCDPVVGEDPEILDALLNADMVKFTAIVGDRNQRFAQWGFKVPNLHRALPATSTAGFRNLRMIVVFRDAVAIARRNELSMLEWPAEAFQKAGENIAQLTSYVGALSVPTLLISYEKAPQHAEYLIDTISAFCGLTPSDEQKAAALAAIAPSAEAYFSATRLVCLGTIDNVTVNTLRGWCRYRDSADTVEIEVLADDIPIGVYLAGDFRKDLLDAGIGLGCHAFNIDLTSVAIQPSSLISVRPAGRTLALPSSGKSVEDLRQHGSKIKTMKIRLIMMLKNEDDLALPWIKYHGSMVGYENLIILDNGSSSDRTLSALRQGAKAGATVGYQYATQSEFVNRGRIYADLIQRMDAEDPADFYLPLDCDEFLAVQRDGRIDSSSDILEEELSSYVKCPSPLAIYAGLDNHPHRPGFFRWSLNQRKTFFAEGACGSLDHGFHCGQSRLGHDLVRTKLVYIHYHYKPYALFIEHSKAKIAPFTTDFSPENMRNYVEERKDAWHCAAHILGSEEEYAEGFHDPAFIEFPEIRDKFEWLGEDLPFSVPLKTPG